MLRLMLMTLLMLVGAADALSANKRGEEPKRRAEQRREDNAYPAKRARTRENGAHNANRPTDRPIDVRPAITRTPERQTCEGDNAGG